MIYEEKLNKLKEKIEKKDYNFTEEELKILFLDKKTYSEVINEIVSDESLWKYLLDVVDVEHLEESDVPDFHPRFMYALLYEGAKAGEFKVRDFEDIIQYINEPQEKIDDLIELLKENGIFLIEDEIIELLDKKDYKTLSKLEGFQDFGYYYYPPDSLIERVRNEFPFDEYYDSHLTQKFLKNISLQDVNDNDPLIIRLNYKKINKNSGLTPLEEIKMKNFDVKKLKIGSLKYLASIADEEEKIEIYKYCYDKGIFVFAESLIKNNIITIEEFKEDLIASLDANHDKIEDYELSKYLSDIILKDKEVFKSLIARGNINYCFESKHLDNDLVTSIINELYQNKEKYIKERIYAPVKKYPELFHCLLDIGNDGCCFDFDCNRENDKLKVIKDREAILEIIKSNNTSAKTQVLSDYKFDNDLELLSELIKSDIKVADMFLNKRDSSGNNLLFNPRILKAYIEVGELFLDRIINAMDEYEQYLIQRELDTNVYNQGIFDLLVDYLAKKYNLNKEHLVKLEQISGPQIIKILEFKNIQQIIKLDDEKFNKFINLLNIEKYNIEDVKAIYDSFQQHFFGGNNPDIMSSFNKIIQSIQNKDDTYKEIIKNIAGSLDKDFFEKFCQSKNITINYNKENSVELLEAIVAKIIENNPVEAKQYTDILHEIVGFYISKKREEHRKNSNIYKDIQIPYTIDPRKNESALARRYFMHKLVEKSEAIIKDGHYIEKPIKNQSLYNELIREGIDPNIVEECIKMYIKIPGDYSIEVKKNVKKISRYAKKLYQEKQQDELLLKILLKEIDEKEPDTKRDYYAKEVDMVKILTGLNITIIEDKILSNEQVYQSLLSTIKRHKIFAIPNEIVEYLNKNGIEYEADNCLAFINYFYKIHEQEKKARASNGKETDNIIMQIPSVISYSGAYSAVSNAYQLMLGKEDSILIKQNPGPNSAYKKVIPIERLDEAISLTKANFERMNVTTPTSNEIYHYNGKQMRVVVGNFTSPINLTHGERTGACMRIGGAGESLFYFCLKNENGFHIRFEDPNTGEYISRVSGFRNGNTVFLNQLRASLNEKKYSNEDVVEFCKLASKQIIEMSASSKVPIDNVFVDRAYATENLNTSVVNTNLLDIKNGLPYFYSDVGTHAILLATTSKTSEFIPVNTDKTNIESYLPARELPYQGNDFEILKSKINRVESVKKYLSGANYEYFEELSFEDGIIYGIVNEDWYVYIDNNGIMHANYIDIDNRALQELNKTIEQIQSMNNNNNMEGSHGL